MRTASNYDYTHESVDHLIENKVLGGCQEILRDELLSPVFCGRNALIGNLPAFTQQEIKFGDILGRGACGIVREVKSIDLCDSSDGTCSSSKSIETSTHEIQSLVMGEDDEGVESLNYSFSSREHLATLCIRNGESRYAVKTLSLEKSSDQKNARARIDLAIEVNYLHVLSHPHIIKIRGIFMTEDPFHAKYFFLMDRLYGTLYDKILEWRKTSEGEKSSYAQKLRALLKGQKLNKWNRELNKERLFIAHDIASAIRYMHKNNVIHRDIKKQNIGFDVRGNVKVFDFGLAKSLRVDRLGHCDFYKLTSKVGSIPYMAPEVALSKPYNEKCDVFSFGILFYEVMSLKPPYVIFDKKDYFRKVIQGGKRPRIKKEFPLMTKQIMKLSWAASPFDRPSMDNICDMTKFDLEEQGIDECIQTRLEFLTNISRHSSSRMFDIDNSELEQSHH